jgi:hypothetical protein
LQIDGAYDNKKNFRYLYDNNIEAAIKVRKSSNSVGCCYCPRRIAAVLKQQKNFEKWKHNVSYGRRWAAETVFSSIKRMLGEYVCIFKEVSKHGKGDDDVESIIIQYVYLYEIENTSN